MQERSQRLYANSSLPLLASLFIAISFLSGCGSYVVTDPFIFTVITAPATTIRANQQMQIASHQKVTGVPLTFYVNGIPGGNSEFGTIDGNGLYTAPAIVPVPNSVTITSKAAKISELSSRVRGHCRVESGAGAQFRHAVGLF